ncbi:hypothetical protein HUS23_13715 [Ectothiorhodospiraceae bacterium 2226]|nr:hypothetical protein HUS23_13715 [Ectothiorhodospiraceae bacterium 2226]
MQTTRRGDYQASDEISLVDLWLLLSRRVWLIVGTLLVALALAVAVAAFTAPKFSVVTTLEIGTRVSGNEIALIESPDAVAAKLNENYIPAALHAVAERVPEGRLIRPPRAHVPPQSELVVIQSAAPAAHGPLLREVHEAALGLLRQDHARIIDVTRQEHQAREAEESAALAALQNEARNLRARVERAEESLQLMAEEIRRVGARVAQAEADRAEALTAAVEGDNVETTLLLMTNDLHQHRARLAELRERVAVHLPNERDADAAEQRRVEGAIAVQRLRVEGARLALENLRETQALAAPRHSREAVSPNIALILIGSRVGAGRRVTPRASRRAARRRPESAPIGTRTARGRRPTSGVRTPSQGRDALCASALPPRSWSIFSPWLWPNRPLRGREPKHDNKERAYSTRDSLGGGGHAAVAAVP